ncbi:tyrosine-type recombinase/integrase [Longispora albida]|uniref:tyrosine-type recombinase/integrase n=1 Tax=Longispora albida TaxID=203523 RepID=UPI00037B6C5E|nr:tyrosine-type recombinase/integrase [Longispora albida]
MASEGSIFKWCTCKTPAGKRLGAQCPDLRRADGNWHPQHGRWAYQLELPKTLLGKRRQLKREPAATDNSKNAARDERDHARDLLRLASGDPALLDEIATLLKGVRPGQPLPDRNAIARRLRAGVPAAISITVGEYLTQWIGERQIDEKTKINYAGHIRNYFLPNLGDIALDKLSRAHIQAMFAAIVKRNTEITAARQHTDPMIRASVRGKKTVAATSMHRIRATLRTALNDAMRKDRLIEHNPAAHVELPAAEKPVARVWTAPRVKAWQETGHIPSSVMVWTPAQAGEFLDYVEVRDPELYPVFALILRRGPRRGEAIGITCDQLDHRTERTATITCQIALHAGSELVYKPVKTQAGDRTFGLDTETCADLQAYWVRRSAQKLAAGPAWPKTIRMRIPSPDGTVQHANVDLFFRRPDGRAWNPDLVSERWDRYVRDSGLPPVGIHDGRHAAATFAKAAGADLKEIQELLGHANVATTGDIYTSILQETERERAEQTARLIPRQRRAA